MTFFLIAAVAVCGFGWFTTRISVKALILYMQGKGYTPPTQDEAMACCDVVIRRMLGLET